MRRFFLISIMLIFSIGVWAQTITLSFTGQDASNHYVQLNRVIVTNLSQNWQETLYWPDTSLTLNNGVGVNDYDDPVGFKLLQNNPNPFNGITDASLMVADAGSVALEITDVNGRAIENRNYASLPAGTHHFRVTMSAAGTYIMTARQNGKTSSIKMINNGSGGENSITQLEHVAGGIITKSGDGIKSNVIHPWAYGDNLTIKGYATICGTECSKQFQRQLLYNETITIYFSESIITPTVAASSVSNFTSNSASVSSSVSGDCGVTSRGFCYDISSNPTISGQHTSNGSGTGSFTGTLSGLTGGTTYYVRAYATNSAGTAYGNEVCFTTTSIPVQDGQPCPNMTTVTDIEGNVYNTVHIGNQCWLKENLRVTKFTDFTPIPIGTTTSQTTSYRYYPGNDSNHVSTYGYLYNWSAVMHDADSGSTNPCGVQGICPTGWHVPSSAEWTQLTDYVSNQSQYTCGSDNTYIAKSLASDFGWTNSTNSCAVGNTPSNNNATNFSAVPAGCYWGIFGYKGSESLFWTSSESSNDYAIFQRIRYNQAISDSGNDTKLHGFSVRCILDGGGTSMLLPTIITANVSSVAISSATCGGNVTSDGGANVTARGVCWSISHNPTLSNNHTSDGSGTGSFTSNLTGLTVGTTYYVRAYATNSVGTAYGNEVVFTTTPTQSQGATIILEAHNVWGDGSGYQLLLDADATAYGSIIPESGPLTSSGDADAATYAAFEYKIPQNADGSTYTTNMVYDDIVTLSIPAGTYDYCITNPLPGDRIWIASSENGRKDNFTFQDGCSYHFFLSKDMNNLHDTVSITVFNSSLSVPTVTTLVANNVTSNSAICGGNVISDGGAIITARGVCWSTSPNPTTSNSHTTDGSSTGIFASNIMGLAANTTYYVRAYATNSAGTVYGNEVIFTTLSNGGTSQDSQPCPTTPTVTDIDGNTYNTVQIGNQCWMKENMRTTHYPDGTAIPYGSTYQSYTVPYYFDYYCGIPWSSRGFLYNWPAAMHTSSSSSNPNGVQGICPVGWHVPSDTEWTQLTDYVSSQSQYVCGSSTSNIAKALASTTRWDTISLGDSVAFSCSVGNTPNSNNATGFSAVPAAFNNSNAGLSAVFWSSTQTHNESFNFDVAWSRRLQYNSASVCRVYDYKFLALSVRCLRDENGGTAQTQLTVTTGNATDISPTSATLNGTVSNPDNMAITAQGFEWKVTDGSSYTQVSATGNIMVYSLTGLTAGTGYIYRAFVTTSAGTTYGSEMSFTTTQPCPGTPTVSDYDGNVYNTVQIGNQCWMKENLRTTHYADGTAIPDGGNNTSYTAPYYYDYTSSDIALNQRGYLYNWPAAMHGASSGNVNPSGVQGICPTGWHVPSVAEWTQLTDYVSSQSQYTCGGNSNYIAKALASTTGWVVLNTYNCAVGNTPSSNNATGFSAVPAGNNIGSTFLGANYGATFWSSTQTYDLPNYAYTYQLGHESAGVGGVGLGGNYGLSMRCVKN